MRVWQSATLSLILLTVVHASPLSRTRRSASTSRRARAAATDGLLHPPVPDHAPDHAPDQTSTHGDTDTTDLEEMSETKEFNMADLHPDQFEDVVDFIKVTISRIRRASGPGVRRERRERKKKKKEGGGGGREVRLNPGGGRRGGGGGGKRGGGCALKQIHMNVSDLGLGFQTSEEMIFSYCSGPCRTSENNYDKILSNLSQRRKLPRDTPPHACCRPIAFDDDLSFLDDNLIYHTMKRHSARKCGCV